MLYDKVAIDQVDAVDPREMACGRALVCHFVAPDGRARQAYDGKAYFLFAGINSPKAVWLTCSF